MLLHKKHTAILSFAVLSSFLLCSSTKADLYGFGSANPYTPEEQILDISTPPVHIVNYREQMRYNINLLANYAKVKNADFQIIVHEGEELLNKNLWEYDLEGYNNARQKKGGAFDPTFLLHGKKKLSEPSIGSSPHDYVKNINGIVLNNLFCSNRKHNAIAENFGLKVTSIDECDSEESFDEAIQESLGNNHLIYGFTSRKNLFKNTIHPIINENAKNIYKTNDANNILFIMNDSHYKSKDAMIEDIRNANFDIIIIDPFFKHHKPFSKEEVESLKYKKNGTKRLIFAEMNISEARTDDSYWHKSWKINNPEWIKRASFVDKNGVIVEYWQDTWKKIISKYFKDIVDSGYDGAFLTGLENHKYFEKQTPLD